MKLLIIFLINIYQMFLSFDKGLLALIAPGGSCKYKISCSEYTKRVILEYGVLRGIVLGGRRILSCR